MTLEPLPAVAREGGDTEISVLTGSEFVGHPSLRDEVFATLRPSYQDPVPLLEAEFRRNDTVYVVEDENRSIKAFFMVGWGTLSTASGDIQAVYLGLSGTRQDQRRSGLRQLLLQRFVTDAQRWETSNGQRLLLWGITGTPSSFLAVHRAFAAVAPSIDGNYDPIYLDAVRAIRASLGVAADWGADHPFVLRSVSSYRYSAAESAAIRASYSRSETHLFADLHINEESGDRLLLVCRTTA